MIIRNINMLLLYFNTKKHHIKKDCFKKQSKNEINLALHNITRIKAHTL